MKTYSVQDYILNDDDPEEDELDQDPDVNDLRKILGKKWKDHDD